MNYNNTILFGATIICRIKSFLLFYKVVKYNFLKHSCFIELHSDPHNNIFCSGYGSSSKDDLIS